MKPLTDERLLSKQEIAKQRQSLHRYLDRTGWQEDRDVSLMLDRLNAMDTNT